MNLTSALTIHCRKIEQKRHISFDVTADFDPFYNESNARELEKRLDVIRNRTAIPEEHELIEEE